MKLKFIFLSAFLVFLMGLNTIIVSQNLSYGLLGYWPMDEGTGINTTDKSELGNEGTLFGDPSWVEGKFEGALLFDGVDDYVDCGNAPILELGMSDFSINAWILTPGDPTQDMSIFAKGGDCTDGIRYHLVVVDHFMRIVMDDNDDPYGKKDPRGEIEVEDSVWHHIVGFRNETVLRVYVDGVEDTVLSGKERATFEADYQVTGTVHPAYIGCIMCHSDMTLIKYFKGVIDDVALWQRALTEEEILYLWNDGEGRPVIEPVSSDKAVAASKGFVLQNYPNPLSSLTTFSFKLPENSHTKLVVCNSFGQEVVVLVNGMRSAGIYKEQFDGSGLPDGIYFARLQTDLYSRTIKISLTR